MKTFKIYDHSSDHEGEEAPTCGAHPSRYDASLTVPPPFFVSLYTKNKHRTTRPAEPCCCCGFNSPFFLGAFFHGFIPFFYLSFPLSSLFPLMWLSREKDKEIKPKARYVEQHLYPTSYRCNTWASTFFMTTAKSSHLITLFLIESFPTTVSP